MDYKQKIINENIKHKDERIDTFVDRKEKSIAWHNAGNISAEIMKSMPPIKTTQSAEKRFAQLRDFIYGEWQGWYLENILPSKKKELTPEKVEALESQSEEAKFNEEEKFEAEKKEGELEEINKEIAESGEDELDKLPL